MHAWLLDNMGGPESLRLAEVPDPIPRAGEILIHLEYAGLNPADRYLSLGQYPARPPLPHILGRDGVGVVAAIGSGVSSIAVGQRVLIRRGETGVTRWGTFAEQVVVNADWVSDVPPGWTPLEAGGAALVYLTAWQALYQWGDLPADAVVLVTGASGGVGVATVQLAKGAGFRVIALSRSPEKQEKLRALGADLAISPEDPNWKKIARDAMEGRKVDLAIDNIGGPLLPEVIDSLGDGGRVSIVGRLAGPVPEFNTASLLFRRLKLGGVHVGGYSAAEGAAAWEKIVKAMSTKGFKPLVDSVWPFGQLKEAFNRLEAGPMGKVILGVGG